MYLRSAASRCSSLSGFGAALNLRVFYHATSQRRQRWRAHTVSHRIRDRHVDQPRWRGTISP
jgi:hypothetical protein